MFDFNNLNPTGRYYWEDNGKPTGEWVDFRLLSDKKAEELRKLAGIKQAVEYRRVGKGGPQRFEFMDTKEEKVLAFLEFQIDYQIGDWHLLNKEKKEVSCTKENKIKLVRESPIFSNWMDECLTQMGKDAIRINEEEEKN